ncbi:MAG: hypothetical protein PVI26_00870 [Chitinispirillia bacterium]|jgi:hypothetical protein
MNQNIIGVATSVSKYVNYDPLDTLQFSLHYNIKIIQIYLNENILFNARKIEKISTIARQNDKIIICHSPYFLNKNGISEKIISAANDIMQFQNEKKIIIHFDERENLTDSLEYVKILNNRGLSVCVENYYQNKNETSFINNLNRYNSLLILIKHFNLSAFPVIDFPRLFITPIFKNFDSLFICKQLCDLIAELSLPTTVHFIDFTNYNQNRSCWCELGKGLMPVFEIFSFLKIKHCIINHLILEFEDKRMFLDSVSKIQRMEGS